MKKNVMKKWVAALRSGKYKQGKGELRNLRTNSFCCLGVLCDISKIGRWRKDINVSYKYKGRIGTLADEMLEWSGIKTYKGQVKPDVFDMTLIRMNDSGASFKEIAEIIEKHWKEL